jgi:hypothetical protein
MSDFELTKTRMIQGIWEGVLTPKSGNNAVPDIQVTHLDQVVADVEIVEDQDAGLWRLRIPVPADAISDGVQTFLIHDSKTKDQLGQFCLIAGDALGDDIRAEMDLLRAELDMLKRAFRRHCLETM